MKRNKIISLFIIILYCLNIFLPQVTAFETRAYNTKFIDTETYDAENYDTEIRDEDSQDFIYINSAVDLISLAKKCSLDVWSRGKTVILNNDIDLSGSDFSSIPTFGGVFDGQGYTIRGLSLKSYGSPQGLFYYVQEGAIVKKLTVKGVVTPLGVKSRVGGIVGCNRGTIQNCTFDGVIKGKEYIGGIAGVNEGSGLISNCLMKGVVYGENRVGGIAGENFGTILLSTNEACINTTIEENGFGLEDLGNINLEGLTSLSTADVVDILDIGGIAGFSSGIIQNCSNNGNVGYRSVGYNIGGIVGRQSGYLHSCINEGTICGRKDVGGIGGQVEPYAFWELSENSFSKLRKELDKLQSTIDKVISHADGYTSDISAQLSIADEYMDSAKMSGESLIDQTMDLLNENIDVINTIFARITQTITAMEPVMELFSSAIGNMEVSIGEFKTVMEYFEDVIDSSKIGMDRLGPAFDKLNDALGSMKEAIDNITRSIDSLKDAMGDPEAIKKELPELEKWLSSLIDGMSQIREGAKALRFAATELQDSQIWKDSIFLIKTGAEELIVGIDDMTKAIEVIIHALELLEGDFDEEELQKALNSLENALEDFAAGTEKLSSGLSKISSSLRKIITAISENEELPDEWYEELLEGLQDVSDSMEDIQGAIENLQDMMEHLRASNIDPEKTEGDFELLKQGLTDLGEGIKDVTGAVSKIGIAADTLLRSDEVKAFGEELNTSIEDIYYGISQAMYAMERIEYILKRVTEQIDYEKFEESMDYLEGSLKEISNALESIMDIKTYVEDAKPHFDSASESVSNAIASAVDAMDSLEKSASDMTEAANKISQLVSDLAKEPEISIKKIDSKYMDTKDQLSHSLGGILDAFSNLNSIISDASPVLLNDIQEVSDQLFVVFDLLAGIAEGVSDMDADIDDYTEDISALDTEDDTNGKIAESINRGLVQGDINVGGIAGAMAIEFEYDLEDEFNIIQKMSPNSKYLLRAVVFACENYGNITSKKDCVGGIVGLMDFGFVKGSIDKGDIESTSGSYVGGIAGKSDGTISHSYAKSYLSGADYTGGIVGFGTNLYNCYSLVNIKEHREFVGAIAGNAEGSWKNNFFVHDELAAINRISYKGKAEPISYKDLLSLQGLPDIFKSFKLTFIAEGEEIGDIIFGYGDSIPQEEIPKVPLKDGFFGKWESSNYENLKFDQIIEAIYEQNISTLASKNTRDNGLSLILVNGSFDEKAILTIEKMDITEESEDTFKGEVLEKWKITVTDDGQESRTVHYLTPNGKDSGFTIYLLQDGTWKKTEYTTKGKYLIFEMEGKDGVFAVGYTNLEIKKVIFIIIAAFVMGVFLFLFIVRKKRKNLPTNM